MGVSARQLEDAAEELYQRAVEELTGAAADVAQDFAAKVLDILADGGAEDDYILSEVEVQLPLIAAACGLAITDVGAVVLKEAAKWARFLMIAALTA